jgi:hypothetical protein
MAADNRIYWAVKPSKEMAEALNGHVDRFEQFAVNKGFADLQHECFRQFHGFSADGSSSRQTSRHGPDGAVVRLVMNHMRAFGTVLANTWSDAIPGLRPVGKTSDYKAESEGRLAENLLRHYMDEGRLEAIIRKAIETATWSGEQWVAACWNPMAGDLMMVDESGRPVYEGDLVFRRYGPLDAIRNPSWKSPEVPWVAFRDHENRHELLAAYGSGADESGRPLERAILDASPRYQRLESLRRARDPFGRNSPDSDDPDLLEVWHLYHEKTPACPLGRQAVVLASGLAVLEDGPLRYDRMPGRRFAPADIEGTPWGYAPLWDVKGPASGINNLWSVVLSRIGAFGLPMIAAPQGSQVSAQDIGQGLRLYEYPPGQHADDIRPVDLCQVPSDVVTAGQRLMTETQMVSGVNDVNLGIAPDTLRSGSALAFADSRAAQFSAGTTRRVRDFVASVASDVIATLRQYVETPRVRALAGQDALSMQEEEFNGQNLSTIRRVQPVPVDPMSATTSGRAEILQMLMTSPDPQYHPSLKQVFSFLATGRMEPVSGRDERSSANIRAVKSLLMLGQPAGEGPSFGALVTDNHAEWIRELLSVIDSPHARGPDGAQVMLHTFERVNAHITLWATASLTNPSILEISGQMPLQTAAQWLERATGIQPLGAPPPATGLPGGESATPGAPAPPKGMAPAPRPKKQEPPPGPGQMPKQPGMPINPATGAVAQDPGGPEL